MTDATKSIRYDLVISVSGGCVNGVFTDIPNANVILVDWDNLAELPEIKQKGGNVEGWPMPLKEMPPETRLAYEL